MALGRAPNEGYDGSVTGEDYLADPTVVQVFAEAISSWMLGPSAAGLNVGDRPDARPQPSAPAEHRADEWSTGGPDGWERRRCHRRSTPGATA